MKIKLRILYIYIYRTPTLINKNICVCLHIYVFGENYRRINAILLIVISSVHLCVGEAKR